MQVNPIYFSDDFEFSDPDVQLTGIEGKKKTTISQSRIISNGWVEKDISFFLDVAILILSHNRLCSWSKQTV